MKENEYLLKTPVRKLLIKFAVPCIVAMLVGALYNIVDQVFIGNSSAGTAGVMATTLVYPFTVLALAIALLIGDGASALYSVALGGKDKESAKKSVGLAILLLLGTGIGLMLLGFAFEDPILNFLGSSGYSPECQAFARDYMTIILAGIPFYVFTSGAASLVRASGAPTFSTISTVVGAVINLIFDPLMIFVFNAGVKGAAIATIAGQIVSALFCLYYFLKVPRSKTASEAESTLTSELVKLSPRSFVFDGKILKKILTLGLSSFITQISIAIITIVANNVVGNIGGVHATDAGGALGIVFKVFGIVISFSVGLAVGGQPIVGFNYGAKNFPRVLESLKLILLGNALIGLVAFALFELAPSAIVSIFGGNASDMAFYEDFAAASFRIYLGGILLCCLSKATSIFLQSIEKPFKAMILSLTRDVIVLVPAVILLGNSGGLYGMLYAGLIADGATIILTGFLLFPEVKKLKA